MKKMGNFVNFQLRNGLSFLTLFGLILLAICVAVNAAPQPSPQSPTDSYTDMLRRGFMRIISLPAETLNMFFRNGGDSSGGESSSGQGGRSQEPGLGVGPVAGIPTVSTS